mmetsp:Transcript_71512/g.155350  ORF Transcript_71512/g.155350 Transcript_71512/m.155350 type:complete len:91 (+) Transcript_71512:140-412(+)
MGGAGIAGGNVREAGGRDGTTCRGAELVAILLGTILCESGVDSKGWKAGVAACGVGSHVGPNKVQASASTAAPRSNVRGRSQRRQWLLEL